MTSKNKAQSPVRLVVASDDVAEGTEMEVARHPKRDDTLKDDVQGAGSSQEVSLMPGKLDMTLVRISDVKAELTTLVEAHIEETAVSTAVVKACLAHMRASRWADPVTVHITLSPFVPNSIKAVNAIWRTVAPSSAIRDPSASRDANSPRRHRRHRDRGREHERERGHGRTRDRNRNRDRDRDRGRDKDRDRNRDRGRDKDRDQNRDRDRDRGHEYEPNLDRERDRDCVHEPGKGNDTPDPDAGSVTSDDRRRRHRKRHRRLYDEGEDEERRRRKRRRRHRRSRSRSLSRSRTSLRASSEERERRYASRRRHRRERGRRRDRELERIRDAHHDIRHEEELGSTREVDRDRDFGRKRGDDSDENRERFAGRHHHRLRDDKASSDEHHSRQIDRTNERNHRNRRHNATSIGGVIPENSQDRDRGGDPDTGQALDKRDRRPYREAYASERAPVLPRERDWPRRLVGDHGTDGVNDESDQDREGDLSHSPRHHRTRDYRHVTVDKRSVQRLAHPPHDLLHSGKPISAKVGDDRFEKSRHRNDNRIQEHDYGHDRNRERERTHDHNRNRYDRNRDRERGRYRDNGGNDGERNKVSERGRTLDNTPSWLKNPPPLSRSVEDRVAERDSDLGMSPPGSNMDLNPERGGIGMAGQVGDGKGDGQSIKRFELDSTSGKVEEHKNNLVQSAGEVDARKIIDPSPPTGDNVKTDHHLGDKIGPTSAVFPNLAAQMDQSSKLNTNAYLNVGAKDLQGEKPNGSIQRSDSISKEKLEKLRSKALQSLKKVNSADDGRDIKGGTELSSLD